MTVKGIRDLIMTVDENARHYDATAEMQYEEGADTAVLKLSYTSDALSYEGSYALTFGENGWAVETKKQDDGRHHPLLRLTKLEKK